MLRQTVSCDPQMKWGVALSIAALPLLLGACGTAPDDIATSAEVAEEEPMDVYACQPEFLGESYGTLVERGTPFPPSTPIEEHGCDPLVGGHVQHSWRAPEDGCVSIATGSSDNPVFSTTKITRESCSGELVSCGDYNYGTLILEVPVKAGELLVIAITADRRSEDADYAVHIRAEPCIE